MSQQTDYWQGEPGNAYIQRQTLSIDNRVEMFVKALRMADSTEGGFDPRSFMEFGASVGDNLRALREMFPYAHLAGIDVNPEAVEKMKEAANFAAVGDITGTTFWGLVELTMTRGVLIHVPPEKLPAAYANLYTHSNRYILIIEYFSPRLEEIPYRGQMGLLWKGPHAYQMMDAYPELKLIDYGFISSRDPVAPQDDLNFWLLSRV